MLTAYDVDFPTSDTCIYCNGTAAVNLADANLCRYHADLEMPQWEKFLPPTQIARATQVTRTISENCPLCGMWGHKEENCPRANR